MDACERGRMTTFTMLCHALYKRGLAPINNLTRLTTTAGHPGGPKDALIGTALAVALSMIFACSMTSPTDDLSWYSNLAK